LRFAVCGLRFSVRTLSDTLLSLMSPTSVEAEETARECFAYLSRTAHQQVLFAG